MQKGTRQGYADYIYTAECHEGQWTLNAWDESVNLVAQAMLPTPAVGYYFLTVRDGVMVILMEGGFVPGASFMESLSAGPEALPAGVAVPVPPADDEDFGNNSKRVRVNRRQWLIGLLFGVLV